MLGIGFFIYGLHGYNSKILEEKMDRQSGILIGAGYLCCAAFLFATFILVLKIMRGEGTAINMGIVPPIHRR